MKKSGFKKKTFKEARAKLLEKQEVMREYAKLGKGKKKVSQGQITGNKRKLKLPKNFGKFETRKVKPKVRKKLTSKPLSWYKKELDRVFSIYIRKINPARCYTCGAVKHRRKLQCGHFVSRQYLATRWKEENCKPQCVGCNMFGNGKPLDFEENLKKDYGNEFVEKMKASRHQILKLDIAWYKHEIDKYKKFV